MDWKKRFDLRMKTMTCLIIATALMIMTGCKELDRVSQMDELEQLLAMMQNDSLDNISDIDSVAQQEIIGDTVLYDLVMVDSIPRNAMKTVIKQVTLKGHEYWTITAMGDNIGGAGITHSESCWCKRQKPLSLRAYRLK